jgi:hypothetical protein
MLANFSETSSLFPFFLGALPSRNIGYNNNKNSEPKKKSLERERKFR